jgi:tripartite-type tricarboxylate transporter receptor subunit TctC
MDRRSCLASLIGLGAGALSHKNVWAATDYPNKPIRVIVPWPAGGVADATTRRICAFMEPLLKTALVVENKAGASGMIGADLVAKAKPDGYTVLRGDMVSLAVTPYLFKNVPYDPVRDFAPISGHARGVMLLVVHPGVKAQSFSELIALAKAHPGTLHYGAPIGASQHLAMELLKQQTGVDVVHVPYKGEGPAMSDLVGGQIQMMFAFVNGVGPMVKAGKLRALVVTRAERIAMFPNLPTVIEAGQPGLEMWGWGGFVAPAGTPWPIIDTLNGAIAKAMAHPELQAFMTNAGSDSMVNTPEQFGELLKAEIKRWAEVVRRSGVKVE